MAQLNFHKVTTLPGVLQANAVYFVENGTYAETYVTNTVGVARSVGNTAMINALIDIAVDTAVDDAINDAIASANAIEIAADITARNTIGTGLNRNALSLVLDATGDPTVQTGGAMYAFNNTNDTYSKVTEYESLDRVITWAEISGKPTSSVAQIDAAVAASHVHANAAVLNALADDAGMLTYNGAPVQTTWSTNNW